MKFSLLFALLLSGCATLPTLESFSGWSAQEVGKDRFLITIGDVKEDRQHEALVYAATFAQQRSYGAFTILDKEPEDSGTHFWSSNSYDGGFGMRTFSPGWCFTILCRQERPTPRDMWFDVARTRRQKLYKPPAPTPAQTP
ncbi:MAG: hypothetical protein V4773_18605 [Verrucomicrobiota bacterium]